MDHNEHTGRRLVLRYSSVSGCRWWKVLRVWSWCAGLLSGLLIAPAAVQLALPGFLDDVIALDEGYIAMFILLVILIDEGVLVVCLVYYVQDRLHRAFVLKHLLVHVALCLAGAPSLSYLAGEYVRIN